MKKFFLNFCNGLTCLFDLLHHYLRVNVEMFILWFEKDADKQRRRAPTI